MQSPVWNSENEGPLAGIRICDFTGQLAGAGATKILAALGRRSSELRIRVIEVNGIFLEEFHLSSVRIEA